MFRDLCQAFQASRHNCRIATRSRDCDRVAIGLPQLAGSRNCLPPRRGVLQSTPFGPKREKRLRDARGCGASLTCREPARAAAGDGMAIPTVGRIQSWCKHWSSTHQLLGTRDQVLLRCPSQVEVLRSRTSLRLDKVQPGQPGTIPHKLGRRDILRARSFVRRQHLMTDVSMLWPRTSLATCGRF